VDGFTVRQAAEALGVSRVRVQHMLRDGQLQAESVGGRWIIPRHEVFRAQRVPRVGGRPFSPERCWGVVDDLVSGALPVEWLHDHWFQLSGRAKHVTGRMLPDLIEDVYDDPNVVIGGAHAAAMQGVAARGFRPPLDVYVANVNGDAYLSSIGMQLVTAEPNITVHLVGGERWDLLAEGRPANLVVAYVDLMEAGERAATEVLSYLVASQQ
jgi:excisionase family DNA binding protein